MWPSQGTLSGYFTDVAAIDASEEHIASFLVRVAGLAENGKVRIIAHSTGNRSLLRAMYRATAQDRKAGSAPSLLIQLGHSYVAEEPDVIRDIRALLYWHEPPAKRRLRNHWPVPDQSAQSQDASKIGEWT